MLKFSNYLLAIALFSPITFMAIGPVPPVKLQPLYGRISTGFPSTEPLHGLLLYSSCLTYTGILSLTLFGRKLRS